jgi:ATP-dependent DNA helicase RecG
METSGKSYEECRSLNQELTFRTLRAEMAARNIEFGAAQMKTLKMIGSDGLYTNLALLLSDQCTHTMKAAVFQGRDNAVFRERKEFSGSLLKQLNDAYQFLDFFNRTEASFTGLRRTDRRDYPGETVREALLNSIIHRDYLFSGSTIINLFDDHIEFISLGGLVRGISMEAIFMGVSQSRNPNLAAVFYRLGLVESYGTGIRKIMRLYQGLEHQPVFKSAEGDFTVELYNRNENPEKKVNSSSDGMDDQTELMPDTEKIQTAVYQKAKEQGRITRKEVEQGFGFGSTKAFKVLKSLCEDGLLIQQKSGNRTVYVPAK